MLRPIPVVRGVPARFLILQIEYEVCVISTSYSEVCWVKLLIKI
jgi:hypothetical protein